MPELNSSEPTAAAPEIANGVVLRTALRFGAGIGLICGLWILGLHLSGNNALGPKRLLVHFAVPLAVVASQWSLRRAVAPARPGVRRTLGVGMLTAVFAAALAAASVVGLGRGAGAEAVDRNRQEMLAIARAEKVNIAKQSGGEAGYQKHVAHLSQLSAEDVAQNDFSKILFMSLLLAVPGGVFFRE